jgi:hypothetical protein
VGLGSLRQLIVCRGCCRRETEDRQPESDCTHVRLVLGRRGEMSACMKLTLLPRFPGDDASRKAGVVADANVRPRRIVGEGHRLKSKNPDSAAVKREAEEDWGR